MKKITITVLSLMLGLSAFAQKKGYKVDINFTEPIKDEVVYLTRYYGKPFPTLIKVDSVKVTNPKKITFQSKEEITGGFHAIVFNDRTKVLEFLLDNGSNFSIQTDTAAKRSNSKVTGSKDNELNFKLGAISEKYETEYMNPDLDSAARVALQMKIGKEINAYRQKVVKENPNLLLSKYYKTFDFPEAPKGKHYLEDGVTIDSLYDFHYVSNHYWDNFDLKDDRILIAPIYERSLENFFTNYVYYIPDSVQAKAVDLLNRTEGSKELYQYTLRWLTNYMLNSKVMGMDEVFVYLVENYHMKGKAPWLDAAGIKEYTDLANKISPTSLGAKAPELAMQDIFSQQNKPLSSVKAKYTAVLFWDLECGNCRKEIQALDTLYHKELKKKGVELYAVAINGDLDKLQKFIQENNGTSWINVADFQNTKEYKDAYNVFGTPTMYLLDKDQKIIGKKISHNNILDIIEWHEKHPEL